MEFSYENRKGLFTVDYFRKKAALQMFDMVPVYIIGSFELLLRTDNCYT